MPIYLQKLENEENDVQNNELYYKIMEDFLILQDVYQNLKKENENNLYYYNYFSKEINEFLNSYLYLESIVQLKSKMEIEEMKNKKIKTEIDENNKLNDLIKEKEDKNKEQKIKNDSKIEEGKKEEKKKKIDEKINKIDKKNENEKIENKKEEIKKKENYNEKKGGENIMKEEHNIFKENDKNNEINEENKENQNSTDNEIKNKERYKKINYDIESSEDIWSKNKNRKKIYYGNEDEEGINLSKYIEDEGEQINIPKIKPNTYQQIKNKLIIKQLANYQGINEEKVDLNKINFISLKNLYSFKQKKNTKNLEEKYNEQENNEKKNNFFNRFHFRAKKDLNNTKHELDSSFQPDVIKNNLEDKKYIPDIIISNEQDYKLIIETDKKDILQKNYQNEGKSNIKNISFNIKNFFDENDEQLIILLLDKIKDKIKEDGTIDEDDSFKIDKIEKPLEIKYNKNCNMNKNNIIEELINNSQIIIEKFFEEISKCNLNFSEIGFCFIIDCSLYLGIWLKFINLIIILSILKSIEIIDIKFSILLTADDKFKVILKDYDEKINYENLIEILYESILIKRFRNNLAKSIKTGIEYLKSKRKNTVFWIFSDSLDESIIYYNYWIKNLFNDETNSFIFFIEKKSSLNYLKNNKIDIITKLWNNFEKKIKEKSKSKVKIIDLNINEKNININDVFKDINNFLNNCIHYEENNNKNDKKKSNRNLNNLKRKEILYYENLLKDETYKNNNEIYFLNYPKNQEDEDFYKIMKNEINEYEKEQIPEYKDLYEKKEIPEIKSFTSKLKQSYQDKTLIESIFYPNKATQKQLSTKGTEIDVMSLILYTLHPVQEPMIYLEEKGGMVRDYSITVIIDNSTSCFCSFNIVHSFLTIINLFQILYSMAIPSLYIIFTEEYKKDPKIILYNKPSVLIFKEDDIFNQILKYLSNPSINTDLGKAIKAVHDIKKIKRNDRESYLFVLTDGLSHVKDEKNINYFSKKCKNIGIKIFGIGLGIFPYKAKDLFETFIYSVNPDNLLKALSKIFGKIIKIETEMKLISKAKALTNEKLIDLFSKMKDINKFYYEDLRKKLEDIEKGEDVLKNFCGIEMPTEIECKIFNVEEGKDLEIYSKNTLITQKILMVMLWSYDLNKMEENPYVHPKYIDEVSKINGGVSIKTVIEHFGIENKIVVDYESAIQELLKKNENGECNYYAVWIFCGPQYPILPPTIDGKPNKSNPNLIEEFINILILFWKNGGALVFFAEGEPLNFQVNLFLEKIVFDENRKPDFKISGNYKGDNNLKQDKTGKLNDSGVFDKKYEKIKIKGKVIQRQSLSHNLGLIYEGVTIGYAVDKKNGKKIEKGEFDKLYPFKPFSINSGGGISTLVYQTDDKGRGDIIIDCGYTKCFLNMYNCGTFRFIQNIAGWTARPEIIFLTENKKPFQWRPKGIDYKVNYNASFNGFLKLENYKNLEDKKTLFAIDNSGSVKYLSFYPNELCNIVKKYFNKDRGDTIYFWNDLIEKISKEAFDLKIQKGELGIGGRGTLIKTIVEIINIEKENNFKHLVIITDGKVEKRKIEEADKIMEKMNCNFDFITVYVLGPDGNLSVGAPFCRNVPNRTLEKKNESDSFKISMTLTLDDLYVIDNLEKYDNYNMFMDNYEKILNALKAKCIGVSENKELENRLKSVINKIINKNEILDFDLFNKKCQVLLAVTRGTLKDAFTLDSIKAAFQNYK